jgi:hypothetical protein
MPKIEIFLKFLMGCGLLSLKTNGSQNYSVGFILSDDGGDCHFAARSSLLLVPK